MRKNPIFDMKSGNPENFEKTSSNNQYLDKKKTCGKKLFAHGVMFLSTEPNST